MKLISVDPGVSSGIVFGHWGTAKALVIDGQYQISGGLEGVMEFFTENRAEFRSSTVVAEKFTPRSGQGFSHTLKSVEPLRVEGALIALNLMPSYPDPRWRQPSAQYFTGGSDPKDRKRRSREFLKEHGLYLTGKSVGQPDADDAISATLHLFGYALQTKHIPTLKKYFKEDE